MVGIGSLTINQILPAFAKCKIAGGGAGERAPGQGPRAGEDVRDDPKNIYNYENFDSIKDNPEIDVVYVVLPNSMHAEYTIRARQGGQARAVRKADGQHGGRVPRR